MSFISWEFALFVPVVLAGYALLDGRALRLWLLVMSYVFYGWGHPIYCVLLFGTTAVDFFVAQRIEAARTPAGKKGWMLVSLVGNLGVLASFKYSGLAVQALNDLSALAGMPLALPPPRVMLPPGISFYTFQTLSYTIDVYRGRLPAARSFLTMALYVAFFPQLVAGPIERAGHLMGQLERKQLRTKDDLRYGVSRILWGVAKKIIMADWLAMFVDRVYANPAAMGSGDLLLATYAFAFQIYLDFSAYCDIAIGSARLLGVRLDENFRWPYLSRNLTEFWTRWHITLSTWLRDYLYLPLSKRLTKAPWRLSPRASAMAGALITFGLCGLWHGAAYTFVLWGLWIGLGFVLYQAYRGAVGGAPPSPEVRWRDVPAILLTFHWIIVSWVFFRSSSVTEAVLILKRMLTGWGELPFALARPEVQQLAGLVAIASAAQIVRGLQLDARWKPARHPVVVTAAWAGLVAAMLFLYAPQRQQFIYFQF